MINLTNFQANGTAQVWQVSSSNVISRLGDIAFTENSLTATLPPQSITLFVLDPGSAVSPQAWLQANPVTSTNLVDLVVNGQPGQTYILQSSSNLVNWASIQTNSLGGNTWQATVPVTKNERMFYRVQKAP